MSNNETDKIIEGHDYDGIQEYDNPLPRWWLLTFVGTVVFAICYYVYYQFMGGPTLMDELNVAMKEIEAVQQAQAPVNQGETEESLTQLMAGAGIVDAGKTAYEGKCAACHGQELQGIIGPNLTDNFWIHGKGSRIDIIQVVRTGVLDKGMPAWESQLKHEEMLGVVAYIISKKGSNPANAKPAQGNPVE
jgi:cytochrome c oxidase cbb3-type subunit 3